MKKLSKYIEEFNNDINGFCILKPEFLQFKDEFEQLLKDAMWEILKSGEKLLSLDQAKDLYSPHKDKDFYNDLCKYMSSDKCAWYACHKDSNNPIKDMDTLKDKVRNMWGKDDMKNAMHSSDSLSNVKREKHIFENL